MEEDAAAALELEFSWLLPVTVTLMANGSDFTSRAGEEEEEDIVENQTS